MPPEKQDRNELHIQLWLFSLCALIFIMVILGGATRLTGSGLSITEWKPIMGAIPPLNQADWISAFEKYKQIPQYSEINAGMTLSEFKSIFWWEWAHRFFGRFIGIAFLIPYLIFTATKKIPRLLNITLIAMFALGALQGVLGWYMVKSGLVNRVDVSQYRLASHLGLAVFIYGFILWVALGLRGTTNGKAAKSTIKWQAGLITALLFLQIIAGAFVAGLKAGLSHNTWPLMDGSWIPDGLWIMSPWWTNLFENVQTVQFNHRSLAYIIVVLSIIHLWSIFKEKEIVERVRVSALILILAITGQIILGILSLLYIVPINLALTHQAGAILLFTIAIWHFHCLWSLK